MSLPTNIEDVLRFGLSVPRGDGIWTVKRVGG